MVAKATRNLQNDASVQSSGGVSDDGRLASAIMFKSELNRNKAGFAAIEAPERPPSK